MIKKKTENETYIKYYCLPDLGTKMLELLK